MRALVYTSLGKVELEDRPEPTAGPEEVVVDVTLVGICGSDVLGIQGRSPGRVPPLVLGHEFTARSEGRPVVVNPIVSCGRCPRCQSGQENLCPRMRLLGLHQDGAMCEKIAVPRRNLVSFSEARRDEEMALAEPLACALHALEMVPPASRKRALIVGFGCLGAMIGILLQHSGTGGYRVIEKNAERAALARRFSGSAIRLEDVEAGSTDVVFDCAGYAQSREVAARALAPGGHLVLVGYGEPQGGVDFTDAVRRELHLHGVMAYTAEQFREAARLLDDGLIDITDLARVFPLREGQSAFEHAQHGDRTVIKTFVGLA